MDNFVKEFVLEMFLDNDGVSTINRLAVAAANVINENNDNISILNRMIKKEFNEISPEVDESYINQLNGHRVKNFYESTVLNYSDEVYIEKFKIKKNTVKKLIHFLKDLTKPDSAVPLDKKVHVFLWIMTTDSSYREIGALFDLHKSSVSYILFEIASILTDQKYYFISWPSIDEQHFTRIKVNHRYKFPNCVGFIDCCYIKVGSKRKKYDKSNIVLLQAVCDDSLMFTDIHIGEMGIRDKTKVYRESQLSDELKNFVDFENHILGDSKYKLRKNLITPFSSDELLTGEEMKFNEVHLMARSYIGHAFELLKERFRRLSYMEITKPEVVNVVLCAACVLHNFVLLHEGCSDIKEEVVACDDGVTIDKEIVQNATEKRQFLCNYINYIDGMG